MQLTTSHEPPNRILHYKSNAAPFISLLSFPLATTTLQFFSLRPFFRGIKVILKMNCYGLQQNAFAACEEIIGSVNFVDQKEPVICPKPRHVGVVSTMPMRHLRWHLNQQAEGSDSKARAELLEIIFKKESHGEEFANQVASSPPFVCGSPPVRAANPLVQDARFGDEKHCPALTISSSSGLLSPSSASRKGGCVRMSFGLKPAAVRVEGFDCLNRDCQNSRIPAVA